MSNHPERVRSIINAFTDSQDQLLAELDARSDQHITRAPAAGGWSATQIGWHVGQTNEWIAAVLSGALPAAQPAPDGFREQAWGSMKIPEKIQTFPQLEPPAAVSRAEANAKIRNAMDQLVAALHSLSEEKARHVVNLPFGTLSLYQIGEFAAGHTERHIGQLKRLEIPA